MSLRKHVFRMTLAGVVFGAGTFAEAQVPPAAPVGPAPTLWHFLGLRQGSWMRRDAFLNKRGNFPGLERKPPLKRIADPSLAEVDNAAIKKAQQIKAEEDLAPQKIKAIKYLATLGCEKCYGGIEEAMLESLKDCTEEVRYETVRALGTIPNGDCPMCDNDCCTEKITEQLAKMAYERDPDHPDCWFEPSARVREAAIETMNVCCPNRGAPPTAEPVMQGDIPVEPGPNTTPVEPGTSTQRKSTGSAALFGGLYGRQPAPPQRSTAARRATTPSQSIAHQPPAQRTPTVWVADQNSQSAQVRPIAQPVARPMPARRPVIEVPPADEAVEVQDAEGYVEAQDAPVYDKQAGAAPAEASPVADAGPVVEQPHSAPQTAQPDQQDEEPVLEPVIRQPSNLTLRAKRPALITASPIPQVAPLAAVARQDAPATLQPVEAQPASVRAAPAEPVAVPRPKMLIQQPANFGAAVRAASAEEPAAYVEARSEEVEVTAADAQPAQAAVSRPTAQPTSARSAAIRPASSAKSSVRGVVAKVSASAGTVQLRFAGGTQPTIGSVVNVQHKYLLTTSEIGQLEIIAAGTDMVTARPIGETNLSKITSGDVVVLQTR